MEIFQITTQGYAAFDAAVGVLRSLDLKGDAQTADAGEAGSVAAAPFSGLRLAPRADFNGIRRRSHIGVKRLLEVLARPPAGEHEVLLGTRQEAVEGIPLEPLEEFDLGWRQLVSDVTPSRHALIVSRRSDRNCSLLDRWVLIGADSRQQAKQAISDLASSASDCERSEAPGC